MGKTYFSNESKENSQTLLNDLKRLFIVYQSLREYKKRNIPYDEMVLLEKDKEALIETIEQDFDKMKGQFKAEQESIVIAKDD